MMENWTIEREIDLDKPIWLGIRNIINIPAMVVGDANAHTWKCVCKRSGIDSVNFTGYTAVAYFVRQKDNVTITASGTIEDNVVSVVLPVECYQLEGALKGILKVANVATGETITLDVIAAKVASGATTNYVETNEPVDITAQIAELQTKLDNVKYSIAVAMAGAFGMVNVDRQEMNNSTEVDNIMLSYANGELGITFDNVADSAVLKFLDLIDVIADSFAS